MGESKGEGGSWLYGLILIIAGAFIVVTGLLNIIAPHLNPVGFILTGIDPSGQLAALATITGWPSILVGAWGFIGGVGLIKDQEWGWGISLVVLSYVIVTFLADFIIVLDALFKMLITSISITQWIELVAIIIAAVGIVYLLLTKYKYA